MRSHTFSIFFHSQPWTLTSLCRVSTSSEVQGPLLLYLFPNGVYNRHHLKTKIDEKPLQCHKNKKVYPTTVREREREHTER
jgi:hypothetical protein